ncbi:MAG TPA: DUF262 domain-containing protein [Flavobacterium sp.]|nr:DUF262 domain-containing protein [Flavobacterium sp.]
MKILNRNSTTINIANFWENYQLKKYTFDPPYQRLSDVWSPSKKSFLIDTILKNFPIPPIFLHQHIDESTGKTMYDVIDGKQRLTSIIEFINNQILTPEDFHSDGFGTEKLSNIKFQDLDKPELNEWKKIFWRYDITVEFIDTDNIDVVNNIFDRLNRNGEPLTKQELRNAKYFSSEFYKLIKKLSGNTTLAPILDKLQRNRLEDEEFVTELLITAIDKEIIAGDKPNIIDERISEFSLKTGSEIKLYETTFNDVVEFIKRLNLNYIDLKVGGVSHFYAIWFFAIETLTQKPIDSIDFRKLNTLLTKFYKEYFLNKSDHQNIKDYKLSMSAATKSLHQRNKRIKALSEFCNNELL